MLDAGDNNVQRGYGMYLLHTGRSDEAIAATRKATEIDPLSSSAWTGLCLMLTDSGRLNDAREACKRGLSINPESSNAGLVAKIELLDRRPQEALVLFRQAGGVFGLSGVAMAEHSLSHAKASQLALNELIAKYGKTEAAHIAATYAWRGEKDKAFEWLDRAYAQHDLTLVRIKPDLLLANLRNDARYGAMVKKLGLPD